MASFLIDSYKVRLEVQRAGNPVVTTRTRILEIASVLEYHGIVERAYLSFSTQWDSWSGTPAVGYYSLTNPWQPVLSGWLPSSEFSFWYDALRSEKPLTLFFNIAPIGGANYVDSISLGTSAASVEPIGEGPVDSSP